MIRSQSKQLKIGWIVPTIGTFGAVREMIEVSNVLIGKGHQVYIYHPDGSDCKWLKCLAKCKRLDALQQDSLDVLIGIVDWQTELYENLLQANARLKAICLLGFSPSEEMAKALRGEVPAEDKAQKIIRDAMKREFLLLTDSSWQVEWIKTNTGYEAGPSFGGVNLEMFRPAIENPRDTVRIIYSGDPRDRKGTDTVEAAIETLKKHPDLKLEFDSYWGRKFGQAQLIDFLQKGDIFLDGHRRAGWCNPVAEAIACGTVPVCTNIGATRDFAINGKTALTVPINDPDMMAMETIRLVKNPDLRVSLRRNGLKHIRLFSYDRVVPQLENVLKKKVYDQAQPI